MLETLSDLYGEGRVLFFGGLLVGLLFGFSAQHSRFCLRASTIEFFNRKIGPRTAIWLLAFLSAVAFVQGMTLLGWIRPEETRQIGSAGSMSGAIIGGLMFGCGMILARGCASRLLVLSATGNLRALMTGLVLTIVAQASLRGVLSGWREALAQLWLVQPGQGRDLLITLGLSSKAAFWAAAGGLALTLILSQVARVPVLRAVAAVGVGLAVALGWGFTFAMTQVSFEPLIASSVTFTGPSADTLMGFVNETSLPMSFDVGLVPGVFLGAATAAALTREIRLQGYEGGPSMLRYLAGAALMGFGAMLAGGCAVGAGVSGGAIFATTAWVALTAMWVGSLATQAAENWVETRYPAQAPQFS